MVFVSNGAQCVAEVSIVRGWFGKESLSCDFFIFPTQTCNVSEPE